MPPVLARTANDLPAARLENFVWSAAWHRGFPLTTDLGDWPTGCHLIPSGAKPTVITPQAVMATAAGISLALVVLASAPATSIAPTAGRSSRPQTRR